MGEGNSREAEGTNQKVRTPRSIFQQHATRQRHWCGTRARTPRSKTTTGSPRENAKDDAAFQSSPPESNEFHLPSAPQLRSWAQAPRPLRLVGECVELSALLQQTNFSKPPLALPEEEAGKGRNIFIITLIQRRVNSHRGRPMRRAASQQMCVDIWNPINACGQYVETPSRFFSGVDRKYVTGMTFAAISHLLYSGGARGSTP